MVDDLGNTNNVQLVPYRALFIPQDAEQHRISTTIRHGNNQHTSLTLSVPMSSIFVIAKTCPGAGFKKIFKIFQSPKYDNYIWHAAYEIEKEFYISFSNDKYVWHAAYEFEKRCSTLVFK